MQIDIGRKNLLDIVVKDGCWECSKIKPTSRGRYYLINTGSRTDGTKKPALLHRYIYKYFYGEIPDGMVVRHKCDNTLCVNPEHLEIGTHKDNMNDMVIRGRSTRGEKSGNHKLKDYQIEEIRVLYDSKKYNQTQIAKIYNVSQRHISNIVNYKNRI